MSDWRGTPLSFEAIKTNSVHIRTNLVTINNMARPYDDELQDWRTTAQFYELADTIIENRLQGKPVVWSMGAHVIKNGLSRYIIEMVRHGLLTHVSGNGATSIHDFELALLGETSEDVARSIEDGSFGMWEETGRYMNEAIQRGAARGLGYGASLYEYAGSHPGLFPYVDDCVFVQCQRFGVPYTCHISIGTDIIHQHPIVDFRALGEASGRDFDTMCQSVAQMDEGGVFLNFGSAISGPEIFLKALSLSRNAGLGMRDVTAANFDIVPATAERAPERSEAEFYYRPRRNFIDRLGQIGGSGMLFHGLHQVTIPHLFEALMTRMKERGLSFAPLIREHKLRKSDLKLGPVKQRSARLTVESLAELPKAAELSKLAEQLQPSNLTERPNVANKPGFPDSPDQAAVPDSLNPPNLLDSPPLSAAGDAAGEPEALSPRDAAVPGWSAPGFDDCAARIAAARFGGGEVLVSLGGNVVGSGVSRYVADLVDRGYITHLAVVGACAFQDFELAAFGQTEEEDAGALAAGTLGMWQEPGAWLQEALGQGTAEGLGYGQSLAAYVRRHPERFPHLADSMLGSCMNAGIPYTVHITIGTDAVQQHPDTDFAVHGWASGHDFQIYCRTVSRLENGAFLNFGSTVTGPEVFLKALSIARNLQYPVHHITTANFDVIRLGDYHKKVGYEDWDYYYRPRKNIIHRPTSLGGKGFHFEGQHGQTIPALWHALTGPGSVESAAARAQVTEGGDSA